MGYEIIEKSAPNGRNVGALVNVDGKEYKVDISCVDDCCVFAVFETRDRQIVLDTAIPIFRKKDVSLDWDSWEKCMDEFLSSVNKC